MAITVQITTTNYVVTATEVSSNINITVDSSTFTVTNVVSNFTVTNVQPTITFTTDGTNGFDFATKFRGEWVYGETYLRNDCVTYQENFYVCKILAATTLVSTIPPPSDPTNWTEVIDIRNITTASIQDLTVANLTVTNTLKVGPLYYSNTAGLYGQVLFTDGSSYANWTNLGDLVLWSLSEDLKTNGFQILTNTSTNLKIKSGPSYQDYSYINIGENATNSGIKFYSNGTGLAAFEFEGADISAPNSNLHIDDIDVDANIRVSGYIAGSNNNNPVNLGTGGIRFNDGTVMTSAGTGSFNLSQIASASQLGVIRVGNNLSIDPVTGILDATYSYSLPAASQSTRGGIKVGNGLEITNGDVLNVTTSSEFGNVSLTQTMRTNGYQIKYSTAGQGFLDLDNNQTRLAYSSNILTLGNSSASLETSNSSIEIIANKSSAGTYNITLDGQDNILLQSPLTKIGRSANTSTLHVQKIYNYAGSYAPEFPAGIQFGDASVQVTAWQTSTLIQSSIVVDFDNPFDP